MDNENKIEIPFGAFDSELIRHEISIPNGFKATIEGDKIILTRIESEDEKVRKALVEMVHDTTGDELWIDYNVHKEEALAWLEKQDEQKPAWSEEDEKMLKSIISTCELAGQDRDSSPAARHLVEIQTNWLKSLKERYTWKPTKQQLSELRCVISGCSFETSILVELEENLKKLL